MSLQNRISELAVSVATKINELRIAQGDLSTLTTNAKASLVVALNELRSELDSATNIDDTTSSSSSTYSSDKINEAINTSISNLLDGAPDAYNTLKELANELTSNDSQIEGVLVSLNNRVRFDEAQTLSASQSAIARTNIGALATSAIGDVDHDFVADFEAALV